jgi:hypothetical protein
MPITMPLPRALLVLFYTQLRTRACSIGCPGALSTMAGYRITPVLVFWTCRDLHWVKFTF